MHSKRIEVVRKCVYDNIFDILDCEPEIDPMFAGKVARMCEEVVHAMLSDLPITLVTDEYSFTTQKGKP